MLFIQKQKHTAQKSNAFILAESLVIRCTACLFIIVLCNFLFLSYSFETFGPNIYPPKNQYFKTSLLNTTCMLTSNWDISFNICIYDPNIDAIISKAYANGNWWSYGITVNIMKWLEYHSGDFIDVGANIGSITLPIATKFSKRMVYAFEANPNNFQLLEMSKQRNDLKNINLNFCAVNAHKNADDARVDDAIGNMGHSQTSVSNQKLQKRTRYATVPYCTLDSVLSNRKNKISIMKLDCEGCEAHALMSAREILSKDKPLILMEVTERYLMDSGINWRDLLLFMQSKGYKAFDWEGELISHRFDLTDATQKDFQKENDTSSKQFEAWFMHSSHHIQ